ncbi:MAG: DUF1993 domain-containing protein [Methylophilaceae bacterium]
MSISMYQISVPMFIKSLNNLSAILSKGERHAEKRKIDQAVFINARLFPDMFPLSRQIQIGTDMVGKGIARLAGIEEPILEDDEVTFIDLQKRIKKTITFLKKIKSNQMIGAETKKIEFLIRNNKFKFKRGDDYLNDWIIPHFFFHMTTAYNILRTNVVNLGKRDFVQM